MDNHVKVENLSKSFNGKTLLSNAYIELATKDIIGVFGRNGTGKTSLLKILFGSLSADQAFMSYNNKPIRQSYKFKQLFSLSTQDLFLPSRLSVAKLISFLVAKQSQYYLLEDEYLKAYLQHKISDLSYGLARYLQAKCVVYSQTPFCLLDEPFSGLSPILCEALKRDILLQAQYKGILIVDHKYEDVLQISNKNYILKNAAIYKLEEASSLLTEF